jgi:patatin-related protein
MTPYACTLSGPSSRTPLDGLGMEVRTTPGLCLASGLEGRATEAYARATADTSAATGPAATMPVTDVPALPDDHDVKDLRLALVCYGGVSLAIYMHGITKEIHRLAIASKAFEIDPSASPYDEGTVEDVYWHALAERARRDGGVRTRVVVDIVAGTSAGGINGIILAKAIGRNLSQDSLRDLWLGRGDIKELLALPKLPGLPLKLAAWSARLPFGKARPPLDGKRMYTWVVEALRDMDASRKENGGPKTLLPEGHPLELRVPITDFYGYDRAVPTFDPKRVTDRWHRHVMRFRSLDGRGQLDPDYNERLAFAARATSCFPVAFPPVAVADLGNGWPGSETFRQDFFPHHELANVPLESTVFVDGGVLDNFPFAQAFDAIPRQAASVEVDRRLIYVQPDPGGPGGAGPGKAPGLLQLFWGGISGIPRREPIVQDLVAIRDRNERVERIRAVLASIRPDVSTHVRDALDPQAHEERKSDVIGTAARELGLSWTSYVRLKLFSVVESLAELASSICGFPRDSNHGFFVRDVLLRRAAERGILGPPSDAEFPSAEQIEFLRLFDLEYGERRIRFTIRAVNDLYQAGEVSRESLNRTKRALYELLRELGAALEGHTELASRVRKLFEPRRLTKAMSGSGSPDEDVEAFLAAHGDALDAVERDLGDALDERLEGFGDRIFETVWKETEGWPEGLSRRVLEAFVGFPFWDVLVFPLQQVGGVGELDRVEVVRISPKDAGILPRPPGKPLLEGIAIMHFGAFFKRRWRENDYLWGRLDGSARLLRMLLDEEDAGHRDRVFRAIVEDEQSVLTTVEDVFEWVRSKTASAVPEPAA